MIHAHIDDPVTKNILGYETGNRAVFDARHGGDPLWVFLDYNVINHRMGDKANFLARPALYKIDSFGNVRLQN